ncbi:MAG: DUF1499 domain-containing protein [bacterium]
MNQSLHRLNRYWYRVIGFLALCALAGCAITRPIDAGDPSPRLSECPPLPNCVSTEASTSLHRVSPFELIVSADDAWPVVKRAVAAMPRTTIVVERPGYLFAKCHSAVFHFVDYLEVLSMPEKGTLAVRSSSLLGISDLGVNYFRVNRLREELKKQGVIK